MLKNSIISTYFKRVISIYLYFNTIYLYDFQNLYFNIFGFELISTFPFQRYLTHFNPLFQRYFNHFPGSNTLK
jgi:hypothetical protein